MLPAGGWQAAQAVLGALGLDQETREDRIHFATSGRVLPAIRPPNPRPRRPGDRGTWNGPQRGDEGRPVHRGLRVHVPAEEMDGDASPR